MPEGITSDDEIIRTTKHFIPHDCKMIVIHLGKMDDSTEGNDRRVIHIDLGSSGRRRAHLPCRCTIPATNKSPATTANVQAVLNKASEAFLEELAATGPFVWRTFFAIAQKHNLVSSAIYPYGSAATQKLIRNHGLMRGKYRIFSMHSYDKERRWRTFMRVVDVSQWPTASPTVIESAEKLERRGVDVVSHMIGTMNVASVRAVAALGFLSPADFLVHISSYGMLWVAGSKPLKLEAALQQFTDGRPILASGNIRCSLIHDGAGRIALVENRSVES